MLKSLTRIISAISVSALMLSCAYAQDSKAALVSIDESVLKSSEIVINDGGKLTKNGDMYEKKSLFSDSDNTNPVVSFGKQDKNAIINMDMEFEFTDKSGGTTAFDGFQLRASAQDKVCWTTDCYVVIIREKSVEIQVFASGANIFLLNRVCEIPKDKKVNVKTGAVDTKDGVYVFVKIDDQLFGALDRESRIKDGGYFNLEWRSDLMMYPTASDSDVIPKVTASYDAKNDKIVTNTEFLTDKKAENVSYEWYISNDGYVNSKNDIVNLSEAFTLLDGENSADLAVMEADIGKYAYVKATADGVALNSEIVYISPADYLLNKGFVACVGYTGAIANGEKFVYDKDNKNVYADVSSDGLAYLPIRAVADAYKMPVKWDDATRTVSIKISEESQTYETSFVVGEHGFVRLRNLMGSSMPGTTYISENRTFLDTSATAQVLAYKYDFYDEVSGLIVLSNMKPNLNADDINALLYEVEDIK